MFKNPKHGPGASYGFSGADFVGNAHLASLRYSVHDQVVYLRPNAPFLVALDPIRAPFPELISYALTLTTEILCGSDRSKQPWLIDSKSPFDHVPVIP